MEKEFSNKVENIVSEAMKKLKTIVDVDTVIGSPITTQDGATIIPISKVSAGFVAGGGEYPEGVDYKKVKEDYPFAGGSGVGFCVTPIGFLVGTKGNLKMVAIENAGAFDKILDLAKMVTDKITDKED